VAVKPTSKPYERLTEKQKLFIEYYLQTQNATLSAEKAGYKAKKKSDLTAMATRVKQQLMPHIQARLNDSKVRNAIMDTDEILATLSRIARGEEKDAFGLDTSNQDKLKALELLGKANQLYVERVKQDTNLDINVSLTGGGNDEALIGETVEPLMLEEGEDE
jgi:phage terminase small subunit